MASSESCVLCIVSCSSSWAILYVMVSHKNEDLSRIQYLVWFVCAFCVSFMWMFVCASVFLPIFVCLSSGTFHNGLLKIHLKGRGLPDFLYTLYGKHAFLVPYSSHVREEGNNLPWHHVIGGESKMVCSM